MADKGKYSDKGSYLEVETGAAAGADLTQGTVAGRGGASGTGVYEQLSLGTNLSMTGTVLSASGGVGGGISIASESTFVFVPRGFYCTGIGSLALNPSTRVFVYRDWIPFQFKLDQMIFYVAGAGSVDAVTLVGIYSNDGNTLLASSGAIASITTGQKTATLGTEVTLPAGFYLFAFGSQSTGNRPSLQAIAASAQVSDAVNTGAGTSIGYATNVIAAGALPATLGALTLVAQGFPWLVLGGST